MTVNSIGDMAHSIVLRRQNTRLASELSRLSQELASGAASDMSKHLRGNYSYLGALEHGLSVLDGYQAAAREAKTITSVMQSSLGRISKSMSTLAPELLSVGKNGLPQAMRATGGKARGELDAMVSALNTTVAGRTLFAGALTDGRAIADAATMLGDLRTALAGETTLAGILSAVEGSFDTPRGGFESAGYKGSTRRMSAFLLGPGEAVDLNLRADAPQIRTTLRFTALAALATDPGLGYPPDLQAQILETAGEGLLSAQSEVTEIRANLGYAEQRIEEIETRIAAETTSSKYAIGELLGVDTYETATRLEEVQFQLEGLYTVTVRLSQLSLVEFMR
ncbi:flagellin [Marimonas lutisalis]|uniref:flagellin n=1 Tax=Marimonas lutisalis TaxID=2545756 RepID=UPI0010F77802|nr:flagellin [Marimonas lutisalis]